MKLLLHTCCTPCLIYPYHNLLLSGIDATVFFYNPNIQPDFEYNKRRDTLQKYVGTNSIKSIFIGPTAERPDTEHLHAEKKWRSYARDERCEMCYNTRLSKTADYAKINGYDSFSTTLLGSIYQDHDLIMRICQNLSIKYNIEFYYRDFRSGFREGQKQACQEGIYRQKFCGCICSLEESPLKEKILATMGNIF